MKSINDYSLTNQEELLVELREPSDEAEYEYRMAREITVLMDWVIDKFINIIHIFKSWFFEIK